MNTRITMRICGKEDIGGDFKKNIKDKYKAVIFKDKLVWAVIFFEQDEKEKGKGKVSGIEHDIVIASKNCFALCESGVWGF